MNQEVQAFVSLRNPLISNETDVFVFNDERSFGAFFIRNIGHSHPAAPLDLGSRRRIPNGLILAISSDDNDRFHVATAGRSLYFDHLVTVA